MKKYKNIIVGVMIAFFFIGVTYSFFYFEKFSSVYVSDNLQEINIDLLIEWSDTPYSIVKTFKSRVNYSITPTITWKEVNISISWVNKRWHIWFEIIWFSWEKFSYLVHIKPNQTFIDTDIANYKVTPTITWFNNWIFNIALSDNEVNNNSIQSTGLNVFTDKFSYDWEYYYSLLWWKIEKYSDNFHHLNTYDIDLWITGLFITNVTDIKTINWNYYLRFNNWKILHWTRILDTISFVDTGNTYSDIWINNNNLVSPLFLNTFTWIRDYEKIWNFLYLLTDTEFQVFYSLWWVGNLELIYSEINSDNLTSFIVNNSILLFNSSWDLSYINNDFQVYYLKDENNISQWISTVKTFNNFKPNLNLWTTELGISASLLAKSTESIVNWFKYSTESWIPVYNQKTLGVKLDKKDFTTLEVTKSLFVDKFSSNYWTILWDWYSIDIKVPIIGYWVTFSSKWLATNISPKLNVWVNDIWLKKFNVNEWEVFIHIRAFDYWMNSSAELIKWPLIVRNNNPKISNPYINTNLINLDWWDKVKFIFKSDKELSSVLVTIEDDNKNLTSYTLAQLDYTENYDGYTYILAYNIPWWTNQLKFNIEWKDLWWNKTSTYYEYNLNSWWFQVLGVSKTNAWIWWNLSKQQKEKWFIYWVASKSNISNEINTDYKFNINDNEFTFIPTNFDSSGNEIVNINLLKSTFKTFIWKAQKDITSDFFYVWWDITKPIVNQQFLNWYFYFHDWNLSLDDLIFSWNWILLINWNLDIKWDVIRDLSSETKKYPNKLGIYVTWNINIFSDTKKIDSYLFSNKRLSTLSVAYDLELSWNPIADNIFKNIDWKFYTDLTSDSKVDLITYENISNNKKLYNIYVLWDDNKYVNNKLTTSWALLWDSIDYNTTSINVVDWILLNDINIVNGWVTTTYFINSTFNWLIEQ